MDNRYEIAEQNGMSREFAEWFFDNKKAGCGNVWFMMMAAMWEGWQGRAAMLQGADGNSPAHSGCRPAQNFTPPAQCGNSPVIPDGWVLVPVEPTEDMIVNGFESEPDESFSDEREWEAYDAMSGCQQAAHRARLCWAAMLAAAPRPEA